MVGTNRKAKENEKANSYGTFIEMRESAKSLGSTVRKKIENAEIIIVIRMIIAREKEKPLLVINSVLIIIMKI